MNEIDSPGKPASTAPEGEDSEGIAKLYEDHADWWHLLSKPADYADEAAFFHRLIQEQARPPAHSMLELGAGGGNNASHLKRHYQMALTDLSAVMLAQSARLNPECEHIEGDMRSLRLGRTFDVVFVHDAVMYMLTEADLHAAIETAWVHCREGGFALFAPDCTEETFSPATRHGGHDEAAVTGGGRETGQGSSRHPRGLRYLEWTCRPDPARPRLVTEFAMLLREGESVRCVHDTHVMGLFPRAFWLEGLRGQGFEASSVMDDYGREIFYCRRPLGRMT